MNLSLRNIASAAVLAFASVSAHAEFVDINLTGFRTFGEFGAPLNSSVLLNIGAGSAVTGYTYSGLTFSTSNGSWRDEFVLSLNDADDGTHYMDWAPSTLSSSGTFGPASGSWNGPNGTVPDFGFGSAPFTTVNGSLVFTVYETFDDAGPNGLDATVTAGTLRVNYTPLVTAVPEPTTYALMGLGLLGVAAMARRRRAR